MDVQRFKANPLMAILRDVEAYQLEPLVEALIAAGWETLEITMNTDMAPELIQAARRFSQGRLMIGAGTVLTPHQLTSARDAGATFIVMPVFVEDVVKVCVNDRIPVFPGALTPQEIWSAWRVGATMVKVFPSDLGGPEYFRELQGPFDGIELMACGGVTAENIAAYVNNGACAFAVGSRVFRKEWLGEKNYARITQALTAYRTALADARNTSA
jgi:2-dehydro-3-deoxyphosphogluconate aldolase/(4S)-4-hydroxy-2-oxoglutarate aldolase